MWLSFLTQIRGKELKSVRVVAKTGWWKARGFYTWVAKFLSKREFNKKKKKKQPAAGIQRPFKKPPPMFFHYGSLQDDSQSLCTAAVQKNRKKLSLIFSRFFFFFLLCNEPEASFFFYLCLCSLHETTCVIPRICAKPLVYLGNYCFFFFCCQHHTGSILANLVCETAGSRKHSISNHLFLAFQGGTRKRCSCLIYRTQRAAVTQ